MHLIFGHRMYGKVDQVGDFCHIATEFFHLCFVPVIPVQSFNILGNAESNKPHKTSWGGLLQESVLGATGFHISESSCNGILIPTSGKSVFFGWLRGALSVSLIGLCVLACISTGEAMRDKSSPNSIAAVVLLVICFGLLVAFGMTFRLVGDDSGQSSITPRRLRLVLGAGIVFVLILAVQRIAEALSEMRGESLHAAAEFWLAFAGVLLICLFTYPLAHADFKRALWMAEQLSIPKLAMAQLYYPDRAIEELATMLGESKEPNG
jgi:hypothetical protein